VPIVGNCPDGLCRSNSIVDCDYLPWLALRVGFHVLINRFLVNANLDLMTNYMIIQLPLHFNM